MRNYIKSLFLSLFVKILILCFVALFGAYLVLEAPQKHANYLRDKVGSKTLRLTSKSEDQGGTGFLIKAPSGKTYILTNAHICAGLGNKVYAIINGRKVMLPVIEISESTDLCLVGYYGAKTGLKLAGSVEAGDIVGLVGHPALLPLALTKGEVLGDIEATVPVPNSFCDIPGPWKKVERFNRLELSFESCIMELKKVTQTTLVALGGNSGSAVVDFFGNVVGVLFATRSSANWGIMIPLEDVREFLRPY